MHRRSLLAAGAALAPGTASLAGCLGLPGGGLRLTASVDSVALPRDAITFTLRNEGVSAVATNLADWHLAKRAHGRWFPLFPFGRPDASSRLEGGASHTWTLRIDDGDREALDALPRWNEEQVTVAGLGAGRYRFVHRDDGDAGDRSATFRAEGDRLSLAPDPGVTVSEDGQGALAIRDGDPGDGGPAVVVERAGDGTAPAQRLIAEQLVRVRPLRNALPQLAEHDAERARYAAPADRARRILLLDDYLGIEPGEPRRFRYADASYVVTVRDGGDDDLRAGE